MNKLIDGIDFFEIESERYWSFPKSYSKERQQKETREMIFSNRYIGSAKKDGHYYRFVKDMDGNMSLQGRNRNVNGIFLNKIGHVPHLHEFFQKLPNGTCLIGELYFPFNEGSKNVTTIMGCLEPKAIARQEQGSKLSYYIFDVWAFNGKSYLNRGIEDRVGVIDQKLIFLNEVQRYAVEFAKYYKGAELWEELQKVLEEGGEGIVITQEGLPITPGKRTARKTLKIKKELSETIDCILTGYYRQPTRIYTGKGIYNWLYWENIKTGEKLLEKLFDEYEAGMPIEPVTQGYFYGWAGSIEIGLLKDDKIVSIGYISGLSDEIKEGIVEEPDLYKGRCCEVNAMEIDEESGSLRHAKFEQFRDDLTIQDCTWGKVYGEGK